jgi:hypothetical protein
MLVLNLGLSRRATDRRIAFDSLINASPGYGTAPAMKRIPSVPISLERPPLNVHGRIK